MAASVIAPPPGFELENQPQPQPQASGAHPPLPDGFELEAPPAAPQPDMAAANKQFSRTVGNALTAAATKLKPIVGAPGEAVDTAADIGSVYAPIEAALNAGTGLLFGFPAYVGGGLGGLISKHLLGLDADPKELADTMQKVMTYQPLTERGQRLTGNLMAPFAALQAGSEAAGHGVTDLATMAGASSNTAAALGAVTDSTIQMLAPSLLHELHSKMAGQRVTADDMKNTAKVIAGEGAPPATVDAVEGSLRKTYDKTGIGPFTVMEDAAKNPEVKADLVRPGDDVPNYYQEYLEREMEAKDHEPVPGDGKPLLDISGPTHDEIRYGETEEHEPVAPESGLLGIPSLPTKEIPISQIKLSNDVPQFKSDAAENGVVEPLGGKFDRTGVAPIQLWERTNGDLEVISGRHRLDLAQRSGENSIPSQIHYENQGFDARMASALDAELNIRDGQGKVKDYVDYFRATKISEATAEQRGLLARSIGKRAYAIASGGSDELVAAHRSGHLSDDAATAIANAAPGEQRLQAVGIKAVQEGKTIGQSANLVRAVKLMSGEHAATTGDMFGFDDSAMKEAEAMAKLATAKQRELTTRLSAITGAAKRPEIARAEGIDIADPKAILKRAEDLKAERAAWDNWSTNPELVAAIKHELHPDEPLLSSQTPEDLKAKTEREGNAAALDLKDKIDREAEHFTLQGETQERHDTTGDMFGDGNVAMMHSGVHVADAVKGYADSYTPFVGVQPLERPPITKRPGAPSPLMDSLRKIFAPGARGDIASRQAGIMRANLGEMAREREMALESLKGYAAAFDKMSVPENIKFIDAIERGAKLADPKMAEAAAALRDLLDSKREEVQNLGKGQLENFNENYFPHIWKDADPMVMADMVARRPLEGSKAFLKKRTIPFTTDGLRWRAYDADDSFIKSFDSEAQAQAAAGANGRVGKPLTPLTTNPVELALLKAREMDKYIYGQHIFQEMKSAGLAKFVKFGERAAPGWTKINDKISTVYRSAEVQIHEGFDQNMMDSLNKFAQDIGVKTQRARNIAGGPGVWGWASRDGRVATKFGGPESVLTHEIGHQLDYQYGLADQFVKDPATKKELRALADLRYEGAPNVSDAYKTYVRKGTEKMANMVHAFVHMPERMKEVAPNTYAKFSEFLDQHPELSGLRDVKPSLRLGTDSETVNPGAMMISGEFYAPDEAATLINNHLSPGLQGNGFYDAWRGIGNAINSAQLGLSLFHVGFTTMDSMVSKVALGVKQVSRGDVLQGAGSIAQGLNPAQPFMNIYKGDRLLRAYLGKLDSPDLLPIVDAIQQAGGRVKQDDFYRNTQVNAFKQALRNEQWGAAAKGFIPTVLDRISAPIFESLVPRQKLGVYFDMAKDWLEQNPNATVAEKREGLGKAWDSVDNRMGQLVYDNVFWNHALKDGLMATVRSVGWNLGTFRELGGGVLDIKDLARDKQFSDRTAYVVALPLVAAIYGAITQYAYTGQGPDSIKDCFFPRTGKIRPDGSEDRVSLPTYMKDVFAYGEDASNFAKYGADPTQTLKNKANPLISTISQMLNNQDYFGGAIRNPADSAMEQVMDEVGHILQQVEPFSYRNYMQQAKAAGEDPSFAGYLSSPSMFGIAPAPGYVTKSAEELESGQVSRMHNSLLEKFKEQIKGGADAESLIPEMLKSGMTKRDIKYIVSASSDTPKPHKLKSFGTAEEQSD